MQIIESETQNWKHYPFVWMLIAIPLSAVIMGVVITTLAIRSDSGLVVDDYYRQGKQINRVLARDRAAYDLGLAASLDLDLATTDVVIRFDPGTDTALDANILLSFIHATKPGLDQQIQLVRVDALTLAGKISRLGAGRWNLSVQTPSWRLTGSLQYPGQSTLRLLPNYFAD